MTFYDEFYDDLSHLWRFMPMEQRDGNCHKMSQIVLKCHELSWRLSQIVVTYFVPSPSRRPLLVFAESIESRLSFPATGPPRPGTDFKAPGSLTHHEFRRFLEGFSKGSRRRFEAVLKGPSADPFRNPSKTLQEPFRDPFRNPFRNPSGVRGSCSRKWKSWQLTERRRRFPTFPEESFEAFFLEIASRSKK